MTSLLIPGIVVCVVRLSVPSSHTQRDSPGGSTRRGQCTFLSQYYEDGRVCLSNRVEFCRYLNVLELDLVLAVGLNLGLGFPDVK